MELTPIADKPLRGPVWNMEMTCNIDWATSEFGVVVEEREDAGLHGTGHRSRLLLPV